MAGDEDTALTADEVIEELGLEPLPREGGLYAVAWREPAGSAIYFLVRPGDFSALHRLAGTELWHHYGGAPARMLLLGPDGSVDRPLLGGDLRAGQRPLVAVPGGTWMAAATTGPWSLLGTTMAPPFDETGFELGHRDELTARYPAAAAEIAAMTRPVGEEP
jgi:predicted cupin superfamily sugar epimerase